MSALPPITDIGRRKSAFGCRFMSTRPRRSNRCGTTRRARIPHQGRALYSPTAARAVSISSALQRRLGRQCPELLKKKPCSFEVHKGSLRRSQFVRRLRTTSQSHSRRKGSERHLRDFHRRLFRNSTHSTMRQALGCGPHSSRALKGAGQMVVTAARS
jgi:hypothetical protein